MGVDRVMYFCGVHSWQNCSSASSSAESTVASFKTHHTRGAVFVVCIVGKMAQDIGMVESIVVSSPSSLVGF